MAHTLTLDLPDPDTPGGGSAGRIELALDEGRIYHVIVGEARTRAALLERLAKVSYAALVPQDGGLIANLPVWENLVLPATYHGNVTHAELETRAQEFLAEFGISGAKFETLCLSIPGHIAQFERRLCAFVRAMLAAPRLLVLDSVFEGLTREEAAKMRQFDTIYRKAYPQGTSVHLTADLHALPELGAHQTLRL